MRRRRKRLKFKISLPSFVLAASICFVVITVGLLLWSMNRSPQLPDISYVPKQVVAGPEGANTKGSKTDTQPGGWGNPPVTSPPLITGGGGTSISQLSQEEILFSIGEKYQILFRSLKNSYEAELSRLVEFARNDYQAASRGEKDISRSSLAVGYYKAGRALEKECDQRFKGLLDQMEKELKLYGLPLDIARKAEKEYADQKSKARKELLMKIARLGG